MHSWKEVLEKIDVLRGDVLELHRLLVKNSPPLSLTNQMFLRLNVSQIHALVALNCLGRFVSHTAADVGKFLGVSRAVASKALNELNRMGIVSKTRDGRTVLFKLEGNRRS